ncbi:MAG: alanine/glycine:cation symporter family protein [Bacteroidales bacterium]|nr:alanine/glycine:cation symporter family protein [Bacteroidales bacterium]
MSFDQVISYFNNLVWSPALIVICLGAGLFFSIRTRFVQVRCFKQMIQLLFHNDKKKKTGISSFQAFAIALAGRVGMGNIAGVATAIAFGGPGAIVWMWIIAFLGAGSAFVEGTLAQIYKVKHRGEFRGGPSYYIEKGLHCKWLAIAFAICAIVACGLLMPTVQSNGIAIAMNNAVGVEPAYVGIGIAFLLGLVIIGSVKRIATVAQFIAPLMAIAYVLLSFVVLGFNYEKIPEIFMLMLKSAFGMEEVFGGIIGSTISWGVKRGIYSNEAGQGSGPIVAGAAKVSHPVKQGLVQAFSVYVDTLLVCSATAVMILSTEMYNVYDAAGNAIVQNAPQLTESSVSFTQAAVCSLMPRMGNSFVSIALIFFAFTTLMAYYYYAETSIVYLFSKHKGEKILVWLLRIGMLLSVFYGSMKESTEAWQLGDIGVGTMAWINVIVILLLQSKAIRSLRDYEKQRKQGLEPQFDPKKLGIKNADFWSEKEE